MKFEICVLESKLALFISPHLDDVAFSCGGTLINLASTGWQVVLCTIFTASVLRPAGFALSCQTDKGLSPDADYMEIRRAEDLKFASLTRAQAVHLPFPEAPHRGYESAPELFAGVKEADEVWRKVSAELTDMVNESRPDLIFAPQGIGNHADHLQTIKAILASPFAENVNWYQDTPYIIRRPAALPSNLLPANLIARTVDISATLERKIAACSAYSTQIEFQFGGAAQMSENFFRFHRKRLRNKTYYLETFLSLE